MSTQVSTAQKGWSSATESFQQSGIQGPKDEFVLPPEGVTEAVIHAGKTVFNEYRIAALQVPPSKPIKPWLDWQNEFGKLNPGTDNGNFVLAGATVLLPSIAVENEKVDAAQEAQETPLLPDLGRWFGSEMGKFAKQSMEVFNIASDDQNRVGNAILGNLIKWENNTAQNTENQTRDDVTPQTQAISTNTISVQIAKTPEYQEWSRNGNGEILDKIYAEAGIVDGPFREQTSALYFGRLKGADISQDQIETFETEIRDYAANNPEVTGSGSR